MCSPALLRCQGGIRRPADVLQFPLLHLIDRRDWPKWLAAAGTSVAGPVPGPVFNHASMLIDAVIEGQGIALARTTLAATDLLNDRLARPFSVAIPLSNTFWIICPKATRNLPKLVAFREWLLAEAAAEVQLLEGRLVASHAL